MTPVVGAESPSGLDLSPLHLLTMALLVVFAFAMLVLYFFKMRRAAALTKLIGAGVPVLYQSVQMHGVNDDVESLAELSRALVNLRVMPYYLHQLDRVAGARHFEVPVERGLELIEQFRARLPGYAVPRYVQ